MNNQPVTLNVAIAGLVSSVISAAAILWPDRLTPELQLAIIAVSNSLIVVATIIVTKSQVTPLSAPRLEQNSEVTVLKGGQPTGDSVIVKSSPPGPVGVEGGATGEAP